MPPLKIRARANPTQFICNSCLSTLRHLRGSRNGARYLSISSTASSTLPSLGSSKSPSRNSTPALSHRVPQRTLLSYSHRADATDIIAESQLQPTHPSPASRGLAPLSDRRLVSLSGPDAAKFLQGLVTNNVEARGNESFYCGFLNARGRVLWDAFIWVLPEGGQWTCYIEVHADEAEELLRHLRRHKLRSKIIVSMVPETEVGIWASWGFTYEELEDPSLISALEDPRAPGFGIRCLFQGNQGATGEKANPPFPIVDTEQYTIRRYLYGIPEGPKEIQRENALPMEFNLDLGDGIDFRKGCYVGQELTIRTKHTGVVRKRVLPVQLYRAGEGTSVGADDIPPFDPASTLGESLVPGEDIKPVKEYAEPKRVRATGKFIAGIGNVGLALCRLEMMTDMRITNEGGTFRPRAEFRVQGTEESGTEVRIKAIVPQWFRERERAVWSKGRRATDANDVD